MVRLVDGLGVRRWSFVKVCFIANSLSTRFLKYRLLYTVTPDDPNADGLRRSKRRRYSPLAWWRLEKVVYGRRENGTCLVPSIKEIHRIPQIKPEPLGARKRRGQSRKKSRTVEPEGEQVLVYDPEEGWDDETDPHCPVLEYGEDGKEADRREILASLSRLNALLELLCVHRCCVHRKDGHAESGCPGRVLLPEDLHRRRVPRSGTARHPTEFHQTDEKHKGQHFCTHHYQSSVSSLLSRSQVFYVVQGAVKFCIHKTNFILATGGMFMVPRGEPLSLYPSLQSHS